MKPIATKNENWVRFYLMLHKPQHSSISDTGNDQPVFNLHPCVIKHLWCYIVDSWINSFLEVCQITYSCCIDLVLNKPTGKERWCYIW